MRAMLATLALVFVLTGCSEKTATTPRGAEDHQPPAVSQEANPSDEEALRFSEALQEAVATSNLRQVNALFDWDALLERGIGDIPCQPKLRDDFSMGVKQSIHERGLTSDICSVVESGGTYKLIRLHKAESEQRALFRLLHADNEGVNYHDLVLAKDDNGRTRAVDIYIVLSAEMVSTTLRRVFLPLAAEADKSVLQRLTRKESEFLKQMKQFTEMADARRRGDPKRVLEIYDGLPPSLQQDKLFLGLRLHAASELDDEKIYEAAIDAFRAAYPEDAAIDLVSLDSFFLKKDYHGALACLERLEKALGTDAHLMTLKANIWIQMDELETALDLCRTAIATEPDLQAAYWSQTTAAVQQQEWDLVLATLLALEDLFELEFDDLSESEFYQPFTRTPQYQKWLQRHAGNTALR